MRRQNNLSELVIKLLKNWEEGGYSILNEAIQKSSASEISRAKELLSTMERHFFRLSDIEKENFNNVSSLIDNIKLSPPDLLIPSELTTSEENETLLSGANEQADSHIVK
jgi:hypothetical protein